MNLTIDADNQAMLISIAFFLALLLFSLGVTQFFRQRSARRQLIGKIRGGGVAVEPVEDESLVRPEKNGPVGTVLW